MSDTVDSGDSNSEFLRRLVKAKAGRDSELGLLLEHYRKYLLKIADDELPPNLVRKESPSDLVQKTFLKAADKFSSFDGTTAAVWKAWLRTILLHNVVDTQRAVNAENRGVIQKLNHTTSEAESVPGFLSELVRHENCGELPLLMSQLSEDHREVIRLRCWDGLEFPQIAVEMGRSEEAAQKLWIRAIKALTRIWKEYDRDSRPQ